METINKQSNKVKHRDWTTIYTNRADQGEEGRKQNWHRTLSPKQPVGDMSTKTKQHAWDEESESETEGGIPQTQGRVRLLNNNKVKSYVRSQMCQPSFLCVVVLKIQMFFIGRLTPFSPVFSPVFVPDHFHRTVILLKCTYSRIRRQQGRLFVLQVYLNGSKSFFLMCKLFLAVWE